MGQFAIPSMLVSILLFEIGCGPPQHEEEAPCPARGWGEEGYLILPLIIDTPSIAEIMASDNISKGVRDDLCILSELSADGDYYYVRFGADLPDNFNLWFTLKVTRDGAVFRLVTDPETLELKWLPDNGSVD